MSKSDKTPIEIIPIPPRGDFVEITDRAITISKTMSQEDAEKMMQDILLHGSAVTRVTEDAIVHVPLPDFKKND